MSTSESEVIEFNFSEVSVKVKINGEDFVLKRATSGEAATYRNRAMSCTKFDKEGNPIGVSGLADLNNLLVHLTLKRAKQTSQGVTYSSVGLHEIEAFPDDVAEALAKKAFELCPSLREAEDTPERLEEQILKLQERLEKARQREAELKN